MTNHPGKLQSRKCGIFFGSYTDTNGQTRYFKAVILVPEASGLALMALVGILVGGGRRP